MEIGFNLLFLAIAVSVFCAWLRCRVTDSRRLGFIQGLLVLSCILVLLFPLISITDDLHSSSDVAEEMAIAARKVHVILHAHLIATPAMAVPIPAPLEIHGMLSWETSIAFPQITRFVSGCRAPPLV